MLFKKGHLKQDFYITISQLVLKITSLTCEISYKNSRAFLLKILFVGTTQKSASNITLGLYFKHFLPGPIPDLLGAKHVTARYELPTLYPLDNVSVSFCVKFAHCQTVLSIHVMSNSTLCCLANKPLSYLTIRFLFIDQRIFKQQMTKTK